MKKEMKETNNFLQNTNEKINYTEGKTTLIKENWEKEGWKDKMEWQISCAVNSFIAVRKTEEIIAEEDIIPLKNHLYRLFAQEKQKAKEETIREIEKIIEKHLANAFNLYVHDEEAHIKGSCSYPMLSICCAEEHKWKDSIKRLTEKIRYNIMLDLLSSQPLGDTTS